MMSTEAGTAEVLKLPYPPAILHMHEGEALLGILMTASVKKRSCPVLHVQYSLNTRWL